MTNNMPKIVNHMAVNSRCDLPCRQSAFKLHCWWVWYSDNITQKTVLKCLIYLSLFQ